MGGLGGVCTEESADGGTDVWSASETTADHLVVMVHGILGRYGISWSGMILVYNSRSLRGLEEI